MVPPLGSRNAAVEERAGREADDRQAVERLVRRRDQLVDRRGGATDEVNLPQPFWNVVVMFALIVDANTFELLNVTTLAS